MLRTANKALLTGAALGLIGLWSATAAQAQLTFTPTNNPSGNEENVLLSNGQTGNTITGTTNQSGFTVQFTSTQTLTAPSNGQARVQPVSGNLNNVVISLPGGTFTDLLFNAINGTGTLNITAVASNGGGPFTLALGNGSNFGTLSDVGGTISSVTLSGASFSDLRQIRISGAANGTTGGGGLPAPVPEPGSVAMLVGIGVTAAGFVSRRKRSRA